MRWALIVLLVGCGRIGFEDELAGADPAGDPASDPGNASGGGAGSGSGGAGPTVGNLVWTTDAGSTWVDGRWLVEARGTRWSATADLVPGTGLFELGIEVSGLGTAQRQFVGLEFVQGSRAYGCEIEATSNGPKVRFGYTMDGTSYQYPASSGTAGGAFVGRLLPVEVDHRTNVQCALAIQGPGSATSSIPSGIVANKVRIVVTDASAEIMYLTRP